MAEKWTPGPWRIGRMPRMIDAGVYTNVAQIITTNSDYQTSSANANLIAAAPDLYEALTLLVTDVQDYEAWQRPCHAVDVARAALSRARGETE